MYRFRVDQVRRIIDIDGDGALEYVLCTQRGNLLTFSSAGEVIYDHQFDNRTINVTTAFGDIVRDRPGLEFAVTGGESRVGLHAAIRSLS
ncbi:MAG: hypothetical protein QGH33_05110 [Pirellulaceae bacterium]|jgi:hypothetical protein|nr:hypothetical protein [Pirellulaceae bacterium]